MNGCHRFGGTETGLQIAQVYGMNGQRAGAEGMLRLAGIVKIGGDMAVSKELLDILICPVCKGELDLKEDQSGLKCRECKRVYPIRDDLPIMLKDQATIEA
jgi:uncharacterized protein YbaR (Trm112 family)